MVMTRPPAYHFRKFLMKNMIPTNSGLMAVAHSHVTINTPGSYHCQCWSGYKMNNDSVCTGVYMVTLTTSRGIKLNHQNFC